jgi:isoquinoline 1-oxidoreductase subunit beta
LRGHRFLSPSSLGSTAVWPRRCAQLVDGIEGCLKHYQPSHGLFALGTFRVFCACESPRASASRRLRSSSFTRFCASDWKVPASELTVADGVITHAASARSLSYGKLAAAAAKLEAPDPKAIKLKDPKDWKIAGKPMKRLDTADKLNGSKIYGIDIRLPDMLCAAIKDCPVFGGKAASYDEAKIAGRPGVRKVVKVKDTAVAVVADTWWRAKTALDALPIAWDESPNASVSSATIAEQLKEGLTASVTNGDRQNGDAPKAIETAAKKVEAVYSTPFLSHATMEPMNATVRLSADKAEVWVPTQNAEASLAALSEASGVPLAKCEAYRTDLGGGFGRRGGTQDYVHQAVEIAKQFPGVPIKLIWSREEDQAHDFFRPISQCQCAAGLDAKGNLIGLHVRVCGQSINATLNPAGIVNGRDRRQLQGLWQEPDDAQLGYTVPNLLIEYVIQDWCEKHRLEQRGSQVMGASKTR